MRIRLKRAQQMVQKSINSILLRIHLKSERDSDKIETTKRNYNNSKVKEILIVIYF